MAADLSPIDWRAQDRLFVAHCSLEGLRNRLPLRWPAPDGTPPSPKKQYRSEYVYLGWEDLLTPAFWEHSSEFDVLLRVVDFAPLRPVLAQCLGWQSARGWTPFDPVSMFLLIGWQFHNHWNRSQTLKNLRDPHYADYGQRFGFPEGCYPTEGGVRYFLTALGQHSTMDERVVVDEERQIEVAVQRLNSLMSQSVYLMKEAGFISPEAWRKAILCPDGMLHQAASTMRCSSVTESCYQPTSPGASRPCPAKTKGNRGCNCDSSACAQVCRHATPRDPSARFVWYEGSNKLHTSPNDSLDENAEKKDGKAVYGYRSLPLRFIDANRRFSLTLLSNFLPASAREEVPASALLLQLPRFYPDLEVDAVAGDAAYGYDLPLSIIYDRLHARRLVDLRAHITDKDKSQWLVRGYDDQGRPVCPYGYAFTANGYDPERRRYKWICAHACLHGVKPLVNIPGTVCPPPECAYQGETHPHGCVRNIGKCFPDGSLRLVRDVPVGSTEWKRLYHRARNAVEGRNSSCQRHGIKRLPVYGDPRARATAFLTDFWDNLATLARLMREATAATGN